MSDASEQALHAEVQLGKEAEQFLRTDVGRYLVERAEEEEREALDKLATVAWWRRRRIQQLQDQVWRARSFQSWLSELIVNGRQAQDHLDTPPE